MIIGEIRKAREIENLQLLPERQYHISDSQLKRRVKRLEIKVEEQAKLIRLLQWQMKEIIKEKAIWSLSGINIR